MSEAGWRALLAGLAIAVAGCGDRRSAARNDLGEAGYALTPAALCQAARADDTGALARMADGGMDLAARDEQGDTALHAAAAAGAARAATFLLERKVDVNVAGAGGRTPLHAAATADQPEMVRLLLGRGADPAKRDAASYKPLLRAVEAGRAGVIEVLAPYVRDDLDTALLLAALLGRPEMIDVLTDFGASVYARTDGGRTALMVAAENGHLGTVNMLLALGGNRFAVDEGGKTAAELAVAAGHREVAAVLGGEVAGDEFGLEGPEGLVAGAFAPAAVGPAVEGVPAGGPAAGAESAGGAVAPRGLDGATLAAGLGQAPAGAGPAGDSGEKRGVGPALAMRGYREVVLPVRVEAVDGGRARLRMLAGRPQVVEVGEGEAVPGSRLRVVRIERRLGQGKLRDGRPTDVSVVEVEDGKSGRRQAWRTGLAATAGEPLALVEDQSTGVLYRAGEGDRFTVAGGGGYRVLDVRPGQVVVEDVASGATFTLPLRGPRG